MERKVEVRSQATEDYLMDHAVCDVDLYNTEPNNKNYALISLDGDSIEEQGELDSIAFECNLLNSNTLNYQKD